ncbi:MAG TPA: TonB-dependent receptor [Blastocatellia bacterium]|nr:TonB-dependent receptor [Blastocatellia bacterium]
MNQKAHDLRLFRILLTGLFFSLFGLTALAQSTSTIQGAVTDPSGAIVSGAKVTVRNQGTGVERVTQTDSDGNYQVAALPPGVYRVEVQASGFQTQAATDLTLEVGRTVTQNLQLKVGGVGETVSVIAESAVIENTTTTVGQVINQRTVQEIPLNGRHFVDLGLLIPGSVTPPQNGFLTAPLRGQGSFAFNTAGNREDTVNFMINGVNLNDMVQNQITFQPSINTVQEFKVDNSTFSAEYGRNSGAIVNIATRSGTNSFHGEAFEFFRNDNLDARNFFDLADNNKDGNLDKPAFKRNQFGAALGGPIFKDKTFFFFSYEGLRQRQGLAISGNVPTDAQRATVTNATVKKLLALVPSPNFGTTQFVGSGTAPVNIDQWTGDVSHRLGQNDQLHGYYAFQRDLRGEPVLQGNTLPGFGDTRQSHRQIFTLNETHTFGSSLVNEARFGFNRIHIIFSPNVKLNPADFGINNGINEPIGLPQINVSGFSFNFGGPNGFPQGRGDLTYVLSDTLSYLRGKHSFKFGGEFRRFYNNNFAQTVGSFGFLNLTDFLNGQANAFTVTLGNQSSSITQGALGFFVQDGYKAKPNLTFELGLRYDWLMSPGERYNRFAVFDPATNSLNRVGAGIGEIYRSNHPIQPRVGFVWDPFKDGKTSVRAGYAILADQPVTNLITGTATNPPLADPRAYVQATTASRTTFSTALTDAAASGLSPTSVDHNFDNAYVQSWNLNVQREITPSLGLTVAYVGSKGTHLRIQRNINQIRPDGTRPFPTLSSSSPVLPGAKLGNILENSSAANSSYNALWITANKRLSSGFQFNASYTFSKSIDYNSQNSQGVVVQDSYNVRGDRGLSDYDARHRFVINWIYELPFKGNRLVEGWQLSSIIQSQSGNPLNVLTNISTFTGTATLRPDLVGPISIIGKASPDLWFSNTVCDPRVAGSCTSSSVFALPVSSSGVFHFGNLGRNVIIGPRFNNVDFSVLKNTKITESVRVQFRAEIFDLFNHANLGQPGRIATVGSTTFGVITGTNGTRFPTGDSGSSRQVQFALKLIF